MNFNFLKIKQTNSLPYVRTKFYATFFTTLITATVNIARDSNGLIYMLCDYLFGAFTTSNMLFNVFKNVGIIFIRCVDVAFNVFVIFSVVDLFLGFVNKRIYSKVSKKRREYLKEVLWESIIPNIVEMSAKENDYLSKYENISERNKKQWCITLSALIEMHKELLKTIRQEGVFEQIGTTGCFNKHYKTYLNDINFSSVYVIFKEEEQILLNLCSVLEKQAPTDESYELLYKQFKDVCSGYYDLTKRLNTNKSIAKI